MRNNSTIAILVACLALIPACRQDIRTELLEAAKSGQSEQVKKLLDAGADVNTQNADGFTALKWAVVRGHTSTVQILLNAGANVNILDNRSQTPLMLALEEDQTQIVELLKKAGAKE
jgi:hypothetical protein